MSAFDPPAPIVRRLVAAALAEDLGLLGDITTEACVDPDRTATAAFVTRVAGTVAVRSSPGGSTASSNQSGSSAKGLRISR